MSNKAPQLVALQSLARQLGWPALRKLQHKCATDVPACAGQVVTWYFSGTNSGGRNDLFLQINELPIGQRVEYAAAVYAIRYRICSGWHAFRLNSRGELNATDIVRLDLWMHRRWYDKLPQRRQFRIAHPECCGFSWKRIREQGLRSVQNVGEGRLQK